MKFERINTKIVVAVGVAIILVLTLIYVLFSTDIIIKHKKTVENTNSNSSTNNTEVVSDEAKDRTKDVNSLNSSEKKYLIEQNFLEYLKGLDPEILEQLKKDCAENKMCPFDLNDLLDYGKEPPTKIIGCTGKVNVTFVNGEAKIDMSGVSCTGASGSNTNIQDPDDTNTNSKDSISEDVKNRTKPSETLTNDEKTYIVADNLMQDLMGVDEGNHKYLQESCSKEGQCKTDPSIYGKYSSTSNSGHWIKGCTGEVFYTYIPGYIRTTKDSIRALEVVEDNTKRLTATQIKLSNVKVLLSNVNAQAGDYVVKQGDGYIKATKDTKDALKVVFDNVEPGKDEIKQAKVYPYYDTTELKAGEYVKEGMVILDTSKVTCKNG